MERDQWLAQVKEEVLEPELPICDPHHHLWDHPGRRYLLDELLADTGSGHNVVSTVFVERFGTADKAALFHDTAARVYHLHPSGGAPRT